MNVEIETEAPIFLFWEYLFQIFGILSLQCVNSWNLQKLAAELPLLGQAFQNHSITAKSCMPGHTLLQLGWAGRRSAPALLAFSLLGSAQHIS